MEPLTVSGTLDSLKTIAAYVLSAAEAAGLEKKAAYKLRLAVDEVATNIILHGYKEAGRTGDIQLTTDLDKTTFTITLEDSAIPYDPYQHLCPDEHELNKELHERPIGGLGVFLAIEGVDKFAYEFVDGHNRNQFTLNLPGAPSLADSKGAPSDTPLSAAQPTR
ncbi:MAG: ATP-binding protein [Cyanobacteria bacterium P01_D01_bin.1]